MFKLKNNRVLVTVFVSIMILSVVAIYIPLLFPPQNQTAPSSGNQFSNLAVPTTSVADASATPALVPTSTPNEKAATPTTSTKTLPASLQGLSSDENALNQIQNSLNK